MLKGMRGSLLFALKTVLSCAKKVPQNGICRLGAIAEGVDCTCQRQHNQENRINDLINVMRYLTHSRNLAMASSMGMDLVNTLE